MSEELVVAEIVGTDLSPPELASIANREHDLVGQAAGSMAMHAVRAGEALDAAKVTVGHGGWLEWLQANFNGSERTARLYAYLHANRQRIADLDLWTLGMNAIQKRLARKDREEQGEQEALEVTTIGNAELRHGDLREQLNDLDGKVAAIVTDPPYPAEFIEEFDALGEVAARILRPGGVLVAMVGQAHLPAYLERLGRHLGYRWCGAYLTEGPATRIHGRKVGTKWKPLLIFDRGKIENGNFITQDVFTSQGEDKEHHHWGQSESGMADIVARLTKPGHLVVDPFLGAGTTAVVCQALGRDFIGCDVDATAIRATERRLAV